MAVMDLSADVWTNAVGMPREKRPDVLVLKGTWWHKTATRSRLSHLSDVVKTEFPDIFTGTHMRARVTYCCAYEAACAHLCTYGYALDRADWHLRGASPRLAGGDGDGSRSCRAARWGFASVRFEGRFVSGCLLGRKGTKYSVGHGLYRRQRATSDLAKPFCAVGCHGRWIDGRRVDMY
jgi:hypothetical protein